MRFDEIAIGEYFCWSGRLLRKGGDTEGVEIRSGESLQIGAGFLVSQPKFVNVQQASSMIGVCDDTILAWLRKGRLPAVNFAAVGKRPIFRINLKHVVRHARMKARERVLA